MANKRTIACLFCSPLVQMYCGYADKLTPSNSRHCVVKSDS